MKILPVFIRRRVIRIRFLNFLKKESHSFVLRGTVAMLFLFSTGILYAQKVSVRYKDVPLKNVLNDVAKQSKLRLAYSGSFTDLSVKGINPLESRLSKLPFAMFALPPLFGEASSRTMPKITHTAAIIARLTVSVFLFIFFISFPLISLLFVQEQFFVLSPKHHHPRKHRLLLFRGA